MLEILGLPFSAHTRKVIVACLYKGLPYELSPLLPLDPPEGFAELNPLLKIPVLRDEDFTLPDSTAIALYLDRVHPERPLYPTDPHAYGRALWIEELVDGALAPHVLHGLLMQRVFGPRVLGLEPDEALIEASLNEHIPARFGDLERALDGDWFAGPFSYADITVASMLINFCYAGERISGERYPKLSAFFGRALREPCFSKALADERGPAGEVPGLDLGVLSELE
jgi:glutathione S-transferase